jgi:hypothetical protein
MDMTMTTAAMVVADLQACGFETRPLSGREFPVPMDVADSVEYRWRLLSTHACARILRAAFPYEPEKMIAHWASAEDLRWFSGSLGERIRSVVSDAVCPKRVDILQEAVLGRKLQHTARRSAEKQEEIDALELANMGRMYA